MHRRPARTEIKAKGNYGVLDSAWMCSPSHESVNGRAIEKRIAGASKDEHLHGCSGRPIELNLKLAASGDVPCAGRVRICGTRSVKHQRLSVLFVIRAT